MEKYNNCLCVSAFDKRKGVNEYFAVCTEDTRIMVVVFDDGSIIKAEERYLINEKNHVIERINHSNRGKDGMPYTTKQIIHLSEYGWKSWQDEYERFKRKQRK